MAEQYYRVCVCTSHILHPFTCNGHLRCFYIFTTVKHAAMNSGVRIYFLISIFVFMDIYSEMELLDHMVAIILYFLRNLHAVLYNDCTNLHSHNRNLHFSWDSRNLQPWTCPYHLSLLLFSLLSHQFPKIYHAGVSHSYIPTSNTAQILIFHF